MNNSSLEDKGILYLISTPIGNLEDITLRALRILKEVDLIACEDTRQTIKLLNHFEIKKPLTSYHEHNKTLKGKSITKLLIEGKNIALVTDAGTPGISDPGEDLVVEAISLGIEVTAVPGPVAAVTGLILSGLPTGRFAFEGFLPMNKRARRERLEQLKIESRTMVFYEAPHKLIYTLNDIFVAFGDRKIVLLREITKKFEEKIRCTLGQAIEIYKQKSPRGEYVLVIEGVSNRESIEVDTLKRDDIEPKDLVLKYINDGMHKNEAIKKVAKEKGINKRDLYNLFIK